MRTSRAILLALAAASIASAQVITTPSLPNGQLNVFYSSALSCTSCTGYSYTVVGNGTPPPGITVSTGGSVSGTPTAIGTYTFDVAMFTPAAGIADDAKQFTITITGPPNVTINSQSFANGTVGAAYSVPLSASGGIPPYTWSISSGALPPGLGIVNNQQISGTPTTTGTFAFTLKVVDTQGNGAFSQTSITVTAATTTTTITTTSLPPGTVGTAYSQQLTCSNCTGWTWLLPNGGLPLGLSLSASGAITGTPTSAGTVSFQVTLSPPASLDAPAVTPSVSQVLSLTINGAPLSITQTTLPTGFVGTAYSTTLTASGGLAPYSWNFQSTSNDGLSIGASTGTISGTPTAAGTFTLTVYVSDSSGLSLTKSFVLTVVASLTIITNSLPNGTVNAAYPTQTLSAGGGQPPYRWAINTGSLPPGLTLDSVFGRISGTPTTAGTYAFTLTVTDNQSNTASAHLSILIVSGVTITVTPITLPSGTVGTAYAQSLSATGGAPPYTWSIVSGSLPAGLALNASTGAITGTPTTAGSTTFVAQATDSNQATGQQTVSLVVETSTALGITTSSLANGAVGGNYSQTLAATGGVTPYTWSVTGNLPAGLTLNSSTGVISGTPTTAGTSNFTAVLTDSARGTASKALSITIIAAPTTLTVTVGSLAAGTAGTAYSASPFTVTGGTPPYSFSLTSSNNDGLSINSSTGAIAGTPTAAGTFSLTVVISDSGSPVQTATKTLSLTVASPTAPTAALNGVPATSGFEQQVSPTLSIGSAYPQAVTGSIVLTFQPAVSGTGVDDSMIQFSNGSRTINFSIPAGSTTPSLTNASSITVMTGTTAGTITLTTTLTSNGSTLGVPAVNTITNAPAVPFISKVTLTQQNGGVSVTVTGFSSTRDMVNGQFTFAPATGIAFNSDNVSVPLNTAFGTWWANPAQTNQYGTEFTLTVPFTLATPTQSVTQVVVVSVTVTLQNSKGASNAVTLSQ